MKRQWILAICWAASPHAYAIDLFKEQPLTDYEFEEQRWEELEARLPPAPQPQNLVALNTAETVRHRYLVDRNSLTVGTDGVVRFVMVIETTGGARNVSFEGLRCDTKESKLYAFGQSGGGWEATAPLSVARTSPQGGAHPALERSGGWVKNRYARWSPITVRGQSHAALLYNEYFCAGGESPTLARVQDLLKRGGYKP